MDILERAAALVWGPATLIIFSAAGIYLTYVSGGVQLRPIRISIGGTARRFTQGGGSGGMSPFQALATALGGTVGTGNIAGVTLALALGGPGVIFWMWVAAFIGMATKYSEVLLAVRFRERNSGGERVGGPMYYIKNGLGRAYRPLAYIFALAGALAAFGMGSAVQSGEIRSALSTFCTAAGVPVGDGFPLAVGLITALLAAAVLLGGLKRLGNVTGLLVPFMSVVYLAACAAVLAANWERVLPSLVEIVSGAFEPGAALGACVGWGFRRGVFSNEAGLGSSPIAHASTTERDCVRQGMSGVFEVFADTVVICTVTGLTLLVSGAMDGGEPTTGAQCIRAGYDVRERRRGGHNRGVHHALRLLLPVELGALRRALLRIPARRTLADGLPAAVLRRSPGRGRGEPGRRLASSRYPQRCHGRA